MAELTVDLTYGSALFQAAEEINQKDRILEDGLRVLEILEREPDLNRFINFPAISAREKKDVLKNIFEGQICRELMNFLCVLVDKGRTAHLAKIFKVYQGLVDEETGCAYGEIYSVEPLSPQQLEKFEAQTSDLLHSKTKLENKLDPKLMGGIKILIEGRIIDASIRKRFDDLGSELI